MKLNKLLMVSAASLLSLATLTGCPKAEVATADQLEAVEKALKQTVLTESGAGSQVVAGSPTDLEGYKNVSLTMTKVRNKLKVSSGEKVDVTIDWSYDSSLEQYVRSFQEFDNEHDLMKFNYGHAQTDEHGDVIDPTYKTGYTTTEFKLKATAKAGPASLEKEFIVNLKHNASVYDKLSIAQIYETEGGQYKWQKDKKNIKGNHNQTYYYVEVSGKVEYVSPDKNWGLLSDGNHMIELYQIKESTDKDVCEVGEYITVKADISQYKGNVQLAYCNFMEKMADHASITPLVTVGELSGNINQKGEEGYQTYCSGIGNNIGTLTDVAVKELRDKDGNVVSAGFSAFNKDARQIIVVTKGGHDIWIAHDYHTAANSAAFGDELSSVVKSLSVGDHVNFKGTLRYAKDGDEPFDEGGEWQLTPYQAGDFVKA